MVAHAKFMCSCLGMHILPTHVNASAAVWCGNSQYSKLNEPGSEDPVEKYPVQVGCMRRVLRAGALG